MDTARIRQGSIEEARRLGYEVNPELPLLDFDLRLRGQDEVVLRCLARYAAVAAAYGFDRAAAWEWLKQEGLADVLASTEREFLDGGIGEGPKAGVESLWVLCWALGLVNVLDFGQICGDNLVGLFPDLKVDADPDPFVAKAELRPQEEIAQALDLAYCLHWSINQASLSGGDVPGQIPSYVVIERRHALEWLAGDADWDEVSLDT